MGNWSTNFGQTQQHINWLCSALVMKSFMIWTYSTWRISWARRPPANRRWLLQSSWASLPGRRNRWGNQEQLLKRHHEMSASGKMMLLLYLKPFLFSSGISIEEEEESWQQRREVSRPYSVSSLFYFYIFRFETNNKKAWAGLMFWCLACDVAPPVPQHDLLGT